MEGGGSESGVTLRTREKTLGGIFTSIILRDQVLARPLSSEPKGSGLRAKRSIGHP